MINPFIDVNRNVGSNLNEQTLIQGLVAEAIQFEGVDVVYLPRTLQKEDTLFHEDPISSFTNSFTIEAYVENVDGFEGDGDMIGAMGFSIKDQVTLQFAQSRFKTVTSMFRPLEGDLIYSKLSNTLFEIKFVEHEQQFYIAGTLPSFSVKCELFDFSGETFSTGIAEVDSVDDTIVDSAGDTVNVGGQPFSDNTNIQNAGNNILDFTETNPFGAP